MKKYLGIQIHDKTKSYPAPSKLRYRLERIWLRTWLRKLILHSLLFVIFSTSLITGLIVFKNEIKFSDLRYTLESFVFERPELSINSIKIHNANPDLNNQIKAMLQLSFPINPLKIDINFLQELINGLESVDFSKIRITETGVLEVFVNERIPVLLHRKDQQLMLLDIAGRRIGEAYSREERSDLPLIVGLGANNRVPEALGLYKVSTPILNRIRGLILIGERRWDIILDHNQRIKLPEKDPEIALLSFFASGQFIKMLSKNYSVVDLRSRDRLVLRKRVRVSREGSI